ncbi:PRC-barrel domain-containing protein [Roseovarius nanhaiticus]|uniref:PRC-barrel domain-containing protein n=1 Tax=Roseovarius nanhaiticus TaxID=573024 RepID=UPI002491DA48|nr:PRC-barrel domain-containing protein [Roseovarius nanhaiticus]
MTFKTLMMTAAASAMIAGGAIAQDSATTGADTSVGTDMSAEGTMAAPAFTSISEMTVGDIVGQSVYQTNGETIGDVDYIIGNQGSAEAVVGIGGFLGLGEYTVALPLSDFSYDATQQMIMLDRTKDALKELPEFDESTAESLPDETPLADLISSNDAGQGSMSDDATASEGSASMDEETSTEGDAMNTDAETSDQATTVDDPAATEEGAEASGESAEGMDEETMTEDDALKMDAEQSDQAVTTEEPATDSNSTN